MVFPLTLATTNKGKRTEWQAITELIAPNAGLQFQILEKKKLFVEHQSLDPVVVAVNKAIHAYKACGMPVLVEDVSFAMHGLNSYPGTLYALMEDMRGREHIHGELAGNPNRYATVTITIAYVDEPDAVRLVRVDQPGKVPEDISGINGFGWDPLFIPKGQLLTYAQMTPELKNECSMRRLAIEALIAGNTEPYRIADSLFGCFFE